MREVLLLTWKAELVDGRRLAADGAPAPCSPDEGGETGEAPKRSSCICLNKIKETFFIVILL